LFVRIVKRTVNLKAEQFFPRLRHIRKQIMAISKIRPLVTSLITSNWLKSLRHSLSDAKRAATGSSHEVLYFHQPDDPYSQLLAQYMPDLQARYEIDLKLVLVRQPGDDVAPERQALEDYSRRDAAKIAPYHKLEFADNGQQPTPENLALARQALAGATDLLAMAGPIGAALWANDSDALRGHALADAEHADAAFEKGTAQRDRLGHYLGGMIYYAGEWYWGVDRLPYLEQRLAKANLRHADARPVSQFQERPAFMAKPASGRLTVEFFPSARSPYSYVAMPETLDLPNHFPVDIVMRPVLPMVMRGLPVPRRKGMYIVRDTKREADRIGVPFGKIFDPVGAPVRRCYSIFPMANAAGKGGALLKAFCEMAWSEGVDVGSDDGMRKVVERAGLDWQEALKVIDTDDWEAEIEANRLQMLASGLWGVPSYRLLDGNGKELFSCWGRDRIWLLACEIQKALAERA
jgi:2-hydroxychromene-2-carboxylate isomerase